MKRLFVLGAVALAGCVATVPAPYVEVQAAYRPPPQPVVSVYVDPPLEQPLPISIGWAPPPMLVEPVPIQPYGGAIWTGGYWAWEGTWVWAHGRWAPPPQPGYGWVNPYYENRGGSVVFINGFWAAPGVAFVAPGLNVSIGLAVVARGVVPGPPPNGPMGVFVPPPPGSRPGIIIPAPIGTAPAVMTSAPPVINPGMRVTSTTNITNNVTHNTTITNNVTNVNNVTIVAPASATANGQAVNASVPAQAHLAAALPPVVKAQAPEPASAKAIPSYTPGRAPMALPAAQVVHAEPARAAPAAAPVQRESVAPRPVTDESAQRRSAPSAPAPVSAPVAQPAAKPAPVAAPAASARAQPAHAPATKAQPAPPAKPAAAKPQAKPAGQPPKHEGKEPPRDKEHGN